MVLFPVTPRRHIGSVKGYHSLERRDGGKPPERSWAVATTERIGPGGTVSSLVLGWPDKGGMAALPLGNPTGNFCWRHRSTYEVTLDDITAAFAQKMPIEQVFDALGDGFHSELLRHTKRN
jgi:hypothetical protein